MTEYLFEPPKQPSLAVEGEVARYPVGRIFCVGRNYAAHAAEMGNEVDREAPFYFTKSPHAVLESGGVLPYPPGSQDVHHEMECVVALGASVFKVDEAEAAGAVFGYGCGLDMTRRDLQQAAKDKRRPWDLGKDGEGMAVLGPLTRAEVVGPIGGQAIRLEVNGETRQEARLSDMIHGISAIIANLSLYYHLQPGDLIMTGTPAGVGPVAVGDHLVGEIEGLAPVRVAIGAAE
ncbi:fumarylacetoacetate hydrolase family protein [Shimia aestuarii]|uniref:fumarylacetoacetate hydrolase family protein n=1 Tax=Shimia aestuarii TaxID=254406 RepID=UPI001FB1C175|nr:fumarylacetoacetate hydrolase family protein [Shimia aestuarii]